MNEQSEIEKKNRRKSDNWKNKEPVSSYCFNSPQIPQVFNIHHRNWQYLINKIKPFLQSFINYYEDYCEREISLTSHHYDVDIIWNLVLQRKTKLSYNWINWQMDTSYTIDCSILRLVFIEELDIIAAACEDSNICKFLTDKQSTFGLFLYNIQNMSTHFFLLLLHSFSDRFALPSLKDTKTVFNLWQTSGVMMLRR